ncbi:MAG: hypothetical protein MZU91_09980 [Desulfosudis oleivorans]|nr:hypothetical protein [Desulfosudis oleivorans]
MQKRRGKSSEKPAATLCRKLRDHILTASDKQLPALSSDAASAARSVEGIIDDLYRYQLKRLVNATGVILHTNLGRAPLCPEALDTNSGGGTRLFQSGV